MIRVTMELIPFGVGEPEHLGTMEIGNTGRGTPTRGKYRARLSDRAGRPWREAHVEDFPRRRLLAWDLLYRVLRDAVGERNE